MEDNIKSDASGIKCDSCDWVDMTVKGEDYINWLNKPCPVCGENVLTEADYNSYVVLTEAMAAINKMSPETLQEMNDDFMKNASEEDMNSVIEMMGGLGNLDGVSDKPFKANVESNNGKLKFTKSDD